MIDLACQIADVMRSINDEYSQYSYECFFRAMDEKFPHAGHEAVIHAQRILENDFRAEPAAQVHILTIKRMLALCRNAIPEGIRVNILAAEDAPAEVVEIAPGEIDLVYEFKSYDRNSPLAITWALLFDAATVFHPKWESVGDGWYLRHGGGIAQDTPESLVGWFQLAYPEFARIAEDALGRWSR